MFAFLEDISLPKWGFLLKERILVERILAFKSWPSLNRESKKSVNGRVIAPENVPIHFKLHYNIGSAYLALHQNDFSTTSE